MPRDFRFPQFSDISRPSFGLFIRLMGLLALLLIAACGSDPTAVPQAATDTLSRRQPRPLNRRPSPTR